MTNGKKSPRKSLAPRKEKEESPPALSKWDSSAQLQPRDFKLDLSIGVKPLKIKRVIQNGTPSQPSR